MSTLKFSDSIKKETLETLRIELADHGSFLVYVILTRMKRSKDFSKVLYSPAYNKKKDVWEDDLIDQCIPNIVVGELAFEGMAMDKEDGDLKYCMFKPQSFSSDEVPHSICIRYSYSPEIFDIMNKKLFNIKGYEYAFSSKDVFVRVDEPLKSIVCVVKLKKYLDGNYTYLDQNYYPMFFKEMLNADVFTDFDNPGCKDLETYRLYEKIAEGESIWEDLLKEPDKASKTA